MAFVWTIGKLLKQLPKLHLPGWSPIFATGTAFFQQHVHVYYNVRSPIYLLYTRSLRINYFASFVRLYAHVYMCVCTCMWKLEVDTWSSSLALQLLSEIGSH